MTPSMSHLFPHSGSNYDIAALDLAAPTAMSHLFPTRGTKCDIGGEA